MDLFFLFLLLQTERLSLGVAMGEESSAEWKKMSSSSSSLLQNNNGRVGAHDFETIKILGKGGFGKVYMVRKKGKKEKQGNERGGDIYAMKVLKRNRVESTKSRIEHTMTERWLLEHAAQTKHPFLTKLRYAYTSATKLYLVMDYQIGGELFFHLQNEGSFSESKAQFYAAEITSALLYLHSASAGKKENMIDCYNFVSDIFIHPFA